MRVVSEASILAEGKRIEAALSSVESKLSADLNTAKLGEILTKLEANYAAVKSLKSELTAAVDAKDLSFDELKEFLKRVRAGTKAGFGDDSLEYERMGGKRISEKKKTTKKATAAVN